MPELSGSDEQIAAFLKTAVEQLARGAVQAALTAASEACHSAPNDPRAHYVYGQAWLAHDQPARAEQAFAAAIKLAPQFADAWINYGVARYRQGAIEDAKTAMRQVLLFAPDHAVAISNLAAFMRISGQSDAAENLLRRQLTQKADDIGARLNLVADLLQEERAAEALALLEEGGTSNGDQRAVRHWHLQKALALLQLRRFEAAKSALAALAALGPIPAEIAPLWHWRHVLLALGQRDVRAARESAGQMEAALDAMGPDAVPEHQIMAHYDLAKFWSSNAAPARAFAHWVAGHKLLARSQPFSRDAHRAFVDANIALFDRARFARGTAGRQRRPGAGLHRRHAAFGHDADRADPRCASRCARRRRARRAGTGLPRPWPRRRRGRRTTHRRTRWRHARRGGRRIISPSCMRSRPMPSASSTRCPGNFNYLGLVALMLPGANIIHCARDPRDIGLSIFTFRFHGEHGYAHDLADLGWYIGRARTADGALEGCRCRTRS